MRDDKLKSRIALEYQADEFLRQHGVSLGRFGYYERKISPIREVVGRRKGVGKNGRSQLRYSQT